MGRTSIKHWIGPIAASFIAAGGSPGLFAAQQPANWLGGAGNWTDPTKWSIGVVPNNNATDTYSVNIDNGNSTTSTATLQRATSAIPTYAVDAITIDGGDSLTLNGVNLQLSQGLSVNGSLLINQETTALLGPNASVTGAGEVIFQKPWQTNSLAASAGTLTIDSGVTVRGGGGDPTYFIQVSRLGSSNTALVNKGLIRAEGTMQIAASSLDNQGVIEVANNSWLLMNADFNLATIGNFVRSPSSRIAIGKTQTNTGQTLDVSIAKGWRLAGGTITGGTLTTSGAGTFYAGYLSGGTLDNVTLNGLVEVDGTLIVTGSLTGNGTIKIGNPEAIEGKGIVNIGAVPAGITVRGGIDAAFDDPEKAKVFLTSNSGTVRAEKSIFNGNGKLRLSGAVSNTGRLELTDGGTLAALNGLTFGTNGKLVVDGGGLLEVTGNLNLLNGFDSLDIRPRVNGAEYLSQVIASYTGTLSGSFNTVTPGISVQYLTASKQIRISGTPVPEPAAVGLSIAMLSGLACRRGGRRRLCCD